jgi:two-component system, LytTR family, response regulator
MPTAVIVDDDALARERLKDLIAEAPLVEVIGEAADGATAVHLIEELRPDIAFLDIEMPVMSGIEVLRRVRTPPVVIFTTAYDNYAVTAFELAAVDYLLKPFGLDRFRGAVERAVRLVDARGGGDDGETERARQRAIETLEPERPLTRLFLRERGAILPLAVAEVMRFEADGDYVVVHTAEHRHLVRLRLQDLESRLGERFLRVHRSHLVNMDHVKRFERHEDGRLIVILSDGARILASRSRSRELLRLAR